tara:strand:- start:197 stop:1543 length:1347 start_codon:yes stop_codon:yes gene_type:complete
MTEIMMVVIYTMILWGFTYKYSSLSTETNTFLVGNREVGVLVGGLSVGVTWLWAPALFVSASKAYTLGIPGLFWFLLCNFLCLIIFGFFAEKLRERVPDGFTLSGFIRDTVSKRVSKFYWGELGFLTVSAFTIQLLAGGLLMNKMTGIDFTLITIVMAAIALSYSLFSGIKGSIITDGVQMVIIAAVCLVLVPWAVVNGGGWETVAKGATGSIFDLDVFLTFGIAVSLGFLAGPFGDQMFYQRAFSIQKDKIKKAFTLGACIFVIVPISMGILGFMGTGLGMKVSPSLVNYEVIKALLPVWAVYPFLFAVMCGLLSTCDSALCAVSGLTSKDWFPTSEITGARIGMITLAVLAVALSNSGVTIVTLFLFHSCLRASTLLPTVQAILYKDIHEPTMFWGLILSVAIGLPFFSYGMWFGGGGTYTAAGAILTVLIGGSLTYVGRKLVGNN